MEKPLSVDLQNPLPIIMVFHTILLLTKEFASQIDKCNSGPMIIESTGLTRLLTILKQLPLYKAVGFFLWHSATVRWQQSGGMGQGSPEGDMFLESASRIWCSISTAKIRWSRGGKWFHSLSLPMTNYHVLTSCFCDFKLCLPGSFGSRERDCYYQQTQQASIEPEAQTPPLPLLASEAHKPKDQERN